MESLRARGYRYGCCPDRPGAPSFIEGFEGPEAHRQMSPEAARAFLIEAARYFERRPTGGEDSAHWSNVYNAKNCREIAEMIAAAPTRSGEAGRCSD